MTVQTAFDMAFYIGGVAMFFIALATVRDGFRELSTEMALLRTAVGDHARAAMAAMDGARHGH